MKFKKILLINYSGKELEPPHWDRLDKLCKELAFVSADDPDLARHFQEADCLLLQDTVNVGKDILDQMPELKYIGMLSTGYPRVDASYAASKKIAVCNIPGYSTQGVAEFTFGAIIDCIRELYRAQKQTKDGNYLEAGFAGTEIKGKNFGVIGLGNIGSRNAEIAKGFGANVRYWSRRRKAQYESAGIQFIPLDELLQTSDFITLNISLTAETHNFLNRERIQSIKKGALVVNTSPMELVDLEALALSLKERNISFILDHSDEMAAEQLAMIKVYSNCILYPAIACTTLEATALKQEIFVANLENFLAGTPTNKVN